MTSTVRYAIGDLARLADVSRRTVRYYVQEGLIPPPLGLGRGNHYTSGHLERLLHVKALQESGRTLEEIRRSGGPRSISPSNMTVPAEPPAVVERTLWRRLTLAPGVELHVASSVRLPSHGRLEELAAWCRLHLGPDTHEGEENND